MFALVEVPVRLLARITPAYQQELSALAAAELGLVGVLRDGFALGGEAAAIDSLLRERLDGQAGAIAAWQARFVLERGRVSLRGQLPVTVGAPLAPVRLYLVDGVVTAIEGGTDGH